MSEPSFSAFEPPYYAVIFTSIRTAQEDSDLYEGSYAEAAEAMQQLASQQPGYLGIESYRNEAGQGVTISYWRTRDDVSAWGSVSQHQLAQAAGRRDWYSAFSLRVARVEEERIMP